MLNNTLTVMAADVGEVFLLWWKELIVVGHLKKKKSLAMNNTLIIY